jgi:hypothetical protein
MFFPLTTHTKKPAIKAKKEVTAMNKKNIGSQMTLVTMYKNLFIIFVLLLP